MRIFQTTLPWVKLMKHNKVVIWGVILLVIALVLVWFMWNLCPTKTIEGYNPYRCGRTGLNYLDVYEQEDYYKENPYGYPNPESYTTAWFQLRRLYDPRRYPHQASVARGKIFSDLLSKVD